MMESCFGLGCCCCLFFHPSVFYPPVLLCWYKYCWYWVYTSSFGKKRNNILLNNYIKTHTKDTIQQEPGTEHREQGGGQHSLERLAIGWGIHEKWKVHTGGLSHGKCTHEEEQRQKGTRTEGTEMGGETVIKGLTRHRMSTMTFSKLGYVSWITQMNNVLDGSHHMSQNMAKGPPPTVSTRRASSHAKQDVYPKFVVVVETLAGITP